SQATPGTVDLDCGTSLGPFFIANGSSTKGDPLWLNISGLQFQNCDNSHHALMNDSATSGGALQVLHDFQLAVRNSVFRNNSAGNGDRVNTTPLYCGGAVSVDTFSEFINCTFVNNTYHALTGTSGANGGAVCLGSVGTFVGCTFINNTAVQVRDRHDNFQTL